MIFLIMIHNSFGPLLMLQIMEIDQGSDLMRISHLPSAPPGALCG